MERQDLPAWVGDVLRRKEAQAEELAAHISDAPDEERARRLRLRGTDAELTRTLDAQRARREASGAPTGRERDSARRATRRGPPPARQDRGQQATPR